MRVKNQQTAMIGWATADAAIGGGALLSLICAACLATLVVEQKMRVKTDSNVAALVSQLDLEQVAMKALQPELERAREELAAKNQEALQATRELQIERQHREDSERRLRQQLLGMQGSMQATMIVVDISHSVTVKMAEGTERPNWGGDGSSWGFIRNQVETYLRHLPIEHYRIIAFNHQTREFPQTSRWATRPKDLHATVEFLDALSPSGTTSTERALRRAAEWKPTNIVLITDGAPSGSNGHFEPQQVQRILQWVGSDEFNIPINVVAINNYFDHEFGTFLHRLAASSGGSFVGL